MQKFIVSSALVLSLFGTHQVFAQHNTCQMAETVLDSLNEIYREEYGMMVCFTDSSALVLSARQLNDLYTGVFNDKRILLAINSEAIKVRACDPFTKVKMIPSPISPDSVEEYTIMAASFTRSGTRYSNDAGVRFSNLLYSNELVVGYMQLNMRKTTRFYYFLFEKNKKTGDWEMKRLELRKDV